MASPPEHARDMNDPIVTKEEEETAQRFLTEGYTILPVEDRKALDRIARRLARLAAQKLGTRRPRTRARSSKPSPNG